MAAKLTLQTPVKNLFMVGEAYAKRLNRLNIHTIEDLLHHYPHRYEDLSLISTISQLQAGEAATVQGQIVSMKNLYTRGGKQLQRAVLADSSGQLEVTWFNQPFLAKILTAGVQVALAGKVEEFHGRPSFNSPEYELVKPGQPPLHTGRLVPVYPETAGVSSKWLRSRIAPLLTKFQLPLTDWLPETIRKDYQLVDLTTALHQIHFPQSIELAEKARHRLAFDELLGLHLQTLQRQYQWQKQKTRQPFSVTQVQLKRFIANLPFTLTTDQQQAIREIVKDVKSSIPMNRLLQGDVGAGKTVVAALACYLAHLNHQKTAFMVPTSILADQHLMTLRGLLTPYGIKIGFFTGSHKPKEKPETIDLFLGTHALLHHQLDYEKLGLVIIDEQHRFGVEQRARLLKTSPTPHLLTMTATPIPRTVALTLYGDLNLSLIETLPVGRKPVKTWLASKRKRSGAYAWIREQIKTEGSQIFIVCPLIEESESERLANVKAATAEFAALKAIFPDCRLALLHGRMKAKEKQTVMSQLAAGLIDILVSTPVVEVGIDIPNATVMLVEAAERYGLAQLHQLRGRVGRGDKQAYCLLFSEAERPESFRRLRAMERHYSGIKLAELDLKLRGPGELYGTSQSGFLNLKIASFADSSLISQTRRAAESLFAKRSRLPSLRNHLKTITIRSVKPN
jgi:ATP-dependent DNA helicase RecG